ncbi:ribonuclease HII [Pontiella sulfatireligans]|uniref:Ribonuclease HII n=1 Tax=Pontiella sulfatireligans TaxID=2750658 RepID=A0A6C2UGG7_9BACT|nr:ribonuclease HII [Pontiella sulfatireligans]VGO18464.1 Ribonuclease HII [Pontiella sulfatireligans]
MPDVLLYEKEAWASGFLRLAGIDEAGRGPLAGPVVAAAVIFDPDYIKAGLEPVYGKLTDSKAMTERRREEYFQILQESEFVSIGVGIIDSAEIDQINILKATHKAMALAATEVDPEYALVDGLPVKGLPCESRSIVKGDALSISISAASIIAKVTRDRIMVELDARYPDYGFSQHKGYGTKRHLEALKKNGATPEHRNSFRPVAELNQLDLQL